MRDARIDSLRVIAILSVLMTHATNAPYFSHPTQAPLGWAVVYTLIAAFNFQLFVFLSGWVAKADTGWRWIAGRATRLMVPYLVWCVVQFGLWYRQNGWGYLLRMFVDPTATNALWFLPALFLCSVVFAVLRRSDALLIAAAAAAVVATPAVAYLGLAKAAQIFPFFVAGHYAARFRWDPTVPAALSPLLVAACWTVPGVGLQWGTPAWYLALSRLGGPVPLYTAQALLGVARFGASIALIAVLAWLIGFRRGAPAAAGGATPGVAASGPARYLASAWRWLGRNTLGLYVGHIYFLRLFVGTGSLAIVTSYASALAGGIALTLLLHASRSTAGLFLGCGFGPHVTRPGRGA